MSYFQQFFQTPNSTGICVFLPNVCLIVLCVFSTRGKPDRNNIWFLLGCLWHSCLKPCLILQELLPKAILGAVVGFLSLFLTWLGYLVFCAIHSPVSPEDSYFSLYLAHVFKQLSSGLSLDFLLCFWTWLDLCLRLRTPANAEESKVSLYFGHVFQELSSMLSFDFLPSFWTWFDLFWRLRPPPPQCQRRG